MRGRVAAAVLAGVLAGGCAGTGFDKLFSDPTAEVAVTSEPAGAQVRASSGQSCPATPCMLTLPLAGNPVVLTVSRPGFFDQTVELRPAVVTNPGDGPETRTLVPNPVSLVLEPAPPPPPPPKKKPPPRRQARPTAAR